MEPESDTGIARHGETDEAGMDTVEDDMELLITDVAGEEMLLEELGEPGEEGGAGSELGRTEEDAEDAAESIGADEDDMDEILHASFRAGKADEVIFGWEGPDDGWPRDDPWGEDEDSEDDWSDIEDE